MFCGTPPAHPDAPPPVANAAPDCDLLAIFKPLQLHNGLESEVKIIATERKNGPKTETEDTTADETADKYKISVKVVKKKKHNRT